MTPDQKEKAQTTAGSIANEYADADIETVLELFKYIKAWVGSRSHDALKYIERSQERLNNEREMTAEAIRLNEFKP